MDGSWGTPELFYESYEDALKDDVKALGGAKAVGKALWPAKEVESARRALNDCLNPERRERLSEEEERLIMREATQKRGFSAAFFFICDDIGVDRPKRKEPRDEIVEIQQSFVRISKEQQAMTDKMNRLMDRLATLGSDRK